MSDTDDTTVTGKQIALAGCSIVWIAGASIVAAFLITLGTLACGAICDQMTMVWAITAAILLALGAFCIWIIISLIRRRISPKLVFAMVATDLSLMLLLVAMFIILGGVVV